MHPKRPENQKLIIRREQLPISMVLPHLRSRFRHGSAHYTPICIGTMQLSPRHLSPVEGQHTTHQHHRHGRSQGIYGRSFWGSRERVFQDRYRIIHTERTFSFSFFWRQVQSQPFPFLFIFLISASLLPQFIHLPVSQCDCAAVAIHESSLKTDFWTEQNHA